jgi:hypothetical protein
MMQASLDSEGVRRNALARIAAGAALALGLGHSTSGEHACPHLADATVNGAPKRPERDVGRGDYTERAP